MIRLASLDDYNSMLNIFEKAKKYMAESGNPYQWGPSYPGPKFKEEIESGLVYVLEDEKVYAVFLLKVGQDPTYSYIEDGEWLNDKVPYGTIHRVASDGSHRGVFKDIVDFSRTKVDNLRIDTHRDNLIMQNLILDYGFKYCGVIYLENGDPRLAYHFEDK